MLQQRRLATRATHIETPSTYEPPHICGYVQFESCEKGFSDSRITPVLNIIQIIHYLREPQDLSLELSSKSTRLRKPNFD